MRRALFLLPLMAAACAQGPTLAQRLFPFVGQSEGELVAQLGVPVRVHEADGRRFLLFEQRRTVAFAHPGFDRPFIGSPWGSPWGSRWGYIPAPPAVAVIGCDITFALRDNRVESFTFRGEGCG